MIKWEYKRISVVRGTLDEAQKTLEGLTLDQFFKLMGENGWEAYSIHPVAAHSGDTVSLHFYFKRPIEHL